MLQDFRQQTGVLFFENAYIGEERFIKEPTTFRFEINLNNAMNACFDGHSHLLISYYTKGCENYGYARVFDEDYTPEGHIGYNSRLFSVNFSLFKEALAELLVSWLQSLHIWSIQQKRSLRNGYYYDCNCNEDHLVGLGELIDAVYAYKKSTNKSNSYRMLRADGLQSYSGNMKLYSVETQDNMLDIILRDDGTWALWSDPKSK